MKKITLIISMLLVYAFGGYADTWDGSTISSWTKGSGTSSDPYLIESAANLAYFRDMVNSGVSYSGKYFKLTTNINFNKDTCSIGSTSSCPFSGTFDGGNFIVSNACENLFSNTKNATIKNITYSGTGRLVLSMTGGSIANCTKMTGGGGLIDRASSVTINNCTNKSSTAGGGIVSEGSNVTISNCVNSGTCSGARSYYYKKKENTYDEQQRQKDYGYEVFAGGIIGRCNAGTITITNCENRGEISVSTSEKYSYGGGIVGDIWSNDVEVIITQCSNKGNVSVSNNSSSSYAKADGFVGCNRSGVSVSIKYCYNNAAITSYSKGTKTNNHVGVTSGENCYNVGLLTKSGTDYTYNNGYSMSGTNSYYLSTTGGTSGKTSTFMRTAEFVSLLNNGSDVYQMDVDNENDGYPIFRKSYVLTVTSSNTAMGTVTGGGTYKYEATTTIKATPKTGYHFVKWNDGNTNASRSVTVTAAATYTATFAIDTHILTVSSANTTMGTVTGGGTYDYNKSVTIKATPKTGYHFVKWNDGNTNASRSITVTKDATYTATFAIDTHILTVSSANTTMGTVTGGGTYDYNSSVTITATPNTGYSFVSWSDDNTDVSRTFTITKDASYTATFEANSYDITVLLADESTGTVSGSGSYKYATTQTISATPSEHYHFYKWNDGNTNNPRAITISGAATYTANFVLDTFALSITVNDATMGTTSGSGSYAYNSSATAQANPNYGYVFKKWNDGNTDNPRVVPITANTNLVANFVLDTFNISALGNDATKGTVTGSGKYPYNTEAILSANAIEHYHFVKWNDNDVTNPRTVTVTKDVSYIATFAIDTFAISAVANNAEMGIVAGSGSYIYGSEQDIEATANYGYVFKNWKDGETAAQRTITVTKNTTYTAIFEKDKFTISVSSSDNTKGTVSTDGGELEYLSEIQLVATPNEHYHFVKWSDGNTEATRTVTVTKDLSLSAEFAIDTFVLSVGETENGTVTGIGEYAYNAEATLTAVPAEHYHFVKWNDGETTNPRNVTVFENKTYSAEFAIDMFTVSLSSNATMGTVQGSDTYAYGETVTISALPNYGYDFKQWSDGNTSASREIVISEDLQLEAVFEKTTFSVNIVSNSNGKGTVTVIGETEYLSEIQLVATPNEHYHFVQWSDGDANATRTVVVTEDMNLTAEFAIDMFEVTIGECENGTITGSGEYAYNTEATLTAVPSEHYHFIKWGDGETVNPRQLTITENASFTAEFAIDTFTVALSTDATMGTVQGIGNYTYGTTVDISAVPNYGYVFKQWSDGVEDATRSIVVSDNVQLEAQFENATFDVKIVSNDESKRTVSVVGEMVYDSEIQLDAVAKEHYHFVKWSDGNVENPRNVTIKEDFNLTAEFAIDTFTVSVSVNKSEMGTIQGAGDYTYGQEATLVAEANEHYTFVKWDDGVTDEERVVTITDNTTYKAIFEKAVYNITAESLDETMGTVKILGDSFTYGDEIVLMATAKSGFHFVKWSDGNEEAARTVEVSGNKIFVAYFEANSTAIDDISNELLITIVNRQILVNGEAPAFVVTVSGQKIANANLKAGVYFVVVDGKTVGVSVQ